VEDIDKIYNHSELYVCIALCYLVFESMRLVIRLMDRYSSVENFQRRLISRALATIVVSLGLMTAAISAYFKWVEGFTIGSGELKFISVLFGAARDLYNISTHLKYAEMARSSVRGNNDGCERAANQSPLNISTGGNTVHQADDQSHRFIRDSTMRYRL